MTIIKYVGPHDGVHIHLGDGRYSDAVMHGDTVDVPADLARSLLEQESNWAKASKKGGED